MAQLPESHIVAVWQLGFEVEDVVGLWVGEGDLPTPKFICDAAARALANGETFYTWKRGLPELRAAIALYHERLHDMPVDIERVIVTSAGMSALMLATQAILGPGDNGIVISPIWPNAAAAMQIVGADVREVALDPTPSGWQLDLGRLEAACDANTRAIYIATPGNPTGWLANEGEIAAIMELARRRGIWVIADEVYNRFVYEPAGVTSAPSFIAAASPDDPLIVVHSFSKAWAMTGWRMGWMVAPARIGPTIDKLIEYNTSGAQPFLQRGCIVAIEEGEGFVAEMVERCRRARDLTIQRLAAMPRVAIVPAPAAFYQMFSIDGVGENAGDTLEFAKRMVREARVGLAPGSAFGSGGEKHFRLCFACSTERISKAMDRLEAFLAE
jgi:aspartate/methionine/tyrosine aminotransferase